MTMAGKFDAGSDRLGKAGRASGSCLVLWVRASGWLKILAGGYLALALTAAAVVVSHLVLSGESGSPAVSHAASLAAEAALLAIVLRAAGCLATREAARKRRFLSEEGAPFRDSDEPSFINPWPAIVEIDPGCGPDQAWERVVVSKLSYRQVKGKSEIAETGSMLPVALIPLAGATAVACDLCGFCPMERYLDRDRKPSDLASWYEGYSEALAKCDAAKAAFLAAADGAPVIRDGGDDSPMETRSDLEKRSK